MKTLKNYKIKTEGRTEELYAKGAEEGYKWSERFEDAEYLSFREDGFIRKFLNKDTFEERDIPEISVNDFLRLNWEPKIWERVYDTYHKKERSIHSVKGDCVYWSGDNYYTMGYFMEHCYPIYPKEKAEKPDAYVTENQSHSQYIRLITTVWGKPNQVNDVHKSELHKYNILSESEYKSKYPDKLMFKEWEIRKYNDAGSLTFDCGCVKGVSAVTLRNLLNLKEKIGGEADLDEVANFVLKHKKELGL